MKTRSLRVLTFTCPTALMLALPPVALAEQSENDALQVANAKISLSDAVAIVEAKTGGRASKAEFENTAEGWPFDVEIVTGKAVSDVHVNAQTGAVLSVADDEIDNDSGERGETD